ncbi:OLC1v1032573C1 [Oldenlandia corymbosa var. corymbosa]|uniref:OLC1v1032573C1 n=1 Tax=Oldenlandia corymbosa var. corymbosa TaxID=529605 RepID=A0AAV1CM14_OLDCO|nr:OLC1v1032573C1 [Oldenlandia corymbosa var. corymbosa]
MGRIGATIPGFCLNRIRPLVRIRSPIVHFKNHFDDDDHHQKEHEKASIKVNVNVDVKEASVSNVVGRKIMVVIDSSAEAKNALHWALTHTVQSHDALILLYVTKVSSNPGNECNKDINPRVSQFLSCMKILCQQKRPEVKVEVSVAQGKEKGAAIVEEAKRQGISLLVLGQKKGFNTTWRLVMMWATGNNKITSGGGMVEYCIQNATCMAIAVRRKSKKLGGYLITTKRQKDFWLLA